MSFQQQLLFLKYSGYTQHKELKGLVVRKARVAAGSDHH